MTNTRIMREKADALTIRENSNADISLAFEFKSGLETEVQM